MGLRSPQEMQVTKTAQEGSGRFSGAVAPKLSTDFVNVLEADIDSDNVEIRKRNEKKIAFAKAKFSNEVERDILIPSMAEVANTQGLNAEDVANKKRKWIQESIDKKLSKEYSEELKFFLQGEIEGKLTRFEKTAVPHVYGQMKKVEDETFKTDIANKINESIEVSADDFELNTKLGELTAKVREDMARKGYPADHAVTKESEFSTISKALHGSISQQIAVGRVDLAVKTLKGYNDELTPKDREKAIKLIEAKQNEIGTNEASNLANRVYDKHNGDLALVEREINLIGGSDKLKRHAMAFAKTRFHAVKDSEKRQLEMVTAKLNRDFVQSGSINQDLLRQMPIKDQEEFISVINKNGGKLPGVTDQSSLEDLHKRLDAADSAKDLPKDIFDMYAHKVAYKDLQTARKKYDRLVEADKTETRAAQRGMSNSEVADIANRSANIAKIPRRDSRRTEGKNSLLDYQEQLLSDNPSITRAELKLRMDKAARENLYIKKEEKKFFGLFTKDKTITNSLRDESPAHHPSRAAALRDRSRGKVSDEKINEMLDTMHKQGIDTTKPLIKF